MKKRLTDAMVKKLETPVSGNRIVYDADVPGFGARVTAKGARAYVLNYRTEAGRERRLTIGDADTSAGGTGWTVSAARAEARRLRREIDLGGDPMGEREAIREAPTVGDMCERYAAQYLAPASDRLKARTKEEFGRLIRLHILPALASLKVAEVRHSDLDALHRKLTEGGKTYAANRVHSMLSRLFGLAVKWGWRADNPARGVERNQEVKRARYLAPDELARLGAALATFPDRQAANIVRLLLLTGARKGELLAATWDQFDLAAGVWTKPAATTKQRAEHRVPLSGGAAAVLAEMRAAAEPGSPFLFPGRLGGHREDIKAAWPKLVAAAGIDGVRIHDLRHTYASVLASAGLSLPVIGALLGHTQAQTTMRYAHLMDDPLRAATERAAAVITGKPEAEVVDLRGRK